MHFQDDVVLHQWGIVRHGNLVQSYHCKSQEWNRHLWKHWEEWREDHPWLEVQKTGLGCSVCKAANVKRNAWSKFKVCRGVSQTISPDLFVDQSPSSVWRKFIKSKSQLLQYPLGFGTSSCASKPRLWYVSSGWINMSKAPCTAWPKPNRWTTAWKPSWTGKRWG